MVRTKAESASRKAVAAKAPRKALTTNTAAASTSAAGASPSGTKVSKYAGGNAICDRPTPDWQKGIGGFLTKKIPNEPQGDDESVNEVQTRVDVHTAGCKIKEHAQGSSSTVETETGEGSHADEPSAQMTESSSCNRSEDLITSPVRRNGMVESDDE